MRRDLNPFRGLTSLVLALGCSSTQAVEVICHADLALTADEVKELFLGDKQLAGGVKLIPVDNAALQVDFSARLLQLEVARYAARWTRKAFRDGLTAPAVKGSDAEVLAYVRSTVGAVGYVNGPSTGVKVLLKY